MEMHPNSSGKELVRDEPSAQPKAKNMVPLRPGELIAEGDDRQKSFLAAIYRVLEAPDHEPQSLEVLQAVVDSLELVTEHLYTPSTQCRQWLSDAQSCLHRLRSMLGITYASSASSLQGKRSKHPVWVAYATLGKTKEANPAALALAGSAVLVGLYEGKPVPKSVAVDMNTVLSDLPLGNHQLASLLWNDIAVEFVQQKWAMHLRKRWREVVRLLSSSTPPPQTNTERIRAQILSSTLNAKAAHRAGAFSHRNLSIRQFNHVIDHIKLEMDADSLVGVLGVLVLRTGLAVDVVAQMELGTTEHSQETLCAVLLVEQGVVELDLEIAVHEAAKPMLGSEPSNYCLQIRLPVTLHRHLQNRLAKQPNARRLIDLYAGEYVPGSASSICKKRDEIEGTWSRLRYTVGILLRQRGFNTLHSALLSGDLGLIPRSKLHYATVTADELYQKECELYQLLGFGTPVDLPKGSKGCGSRVVPTMENLVNHDRSLTEKVDAERPGKHAGLSRLYRFHNEFTLLCAWRLSVLLALRATRSIDIDASIQESSDRWIAIHDKYTPADRGFQPVPLCRYGAEVIRLYKAHCAAMNLRVQRIEGRPTKFSQWCASVSHGNRQRLLACVDKTGDARNVSSIEFTTTASSPYRLPNDVGRKVMENMLREEGIRSSHIDAVLRHFTTGQIRSNSFNPENLQSFVHRTARALDRIAMKLFGPHVAGLSRA